MKTKTVKTTPKARRTPTQRPKRKSTARLPALTDEMIESGADLSASMRNGRAVPALSKAKRATHKPQPPAEPLLTVTLDAEASSLVRAWAEILHHEPDDVATGLLLDSGPQYLAEYREDMARLLEGKNRLYNENADAILRCVLKAALRRAQAGKEAS